MQAIQLWSRPRSALAEARKAVLRSPVPDVAGRLVGWDALSVIGDSHAEVFYYIRKQRTLPRTFIEITSVGGATALGLANPNSETNALATFEATLRKVPRDRKTLFMLGEVDCGFLVWYLAQVRGTSVEVEFSRSLARYQAFMSDVLSSGRRRVALATVLPPTVEDYSTWTGLGNARRDVRATLAERTELTTSYNREMRQWAAQHACAYLDLWSETIDPGTGLIAEDWRNPDPLDHHLSNQRLAPLVVAKLRSLRWPPA
jgi:hypothetical protein